jgi:hypothetical protein
MQRKGATELEIFGSRNEEDSLKESLPLQIET